MTSHYEPNIYEKIGGALKSIRLEKKMTLKDIEAISDLAGPTISNIERGKQNVSLGWIVHYSNALQINPSEVFLRAFKDDFQTQQLNKMYERFGPYKTDEPE
ncbi:helix-turn-helix domain-containing protein (plasmid) [Metaplanococcus flavidus]